MSVKKIQQNSVTNMDTYHNKLVGARNIVSRDSKKRIVTNISLAICLDCKRELKFDAK